MADNMNNKNDDLIALNIFQDSTLVERQAVSTIIALNETTAQYGLTLTGQQAAELIVCRNQSLTASGRVEFGGGALDRIILAFCDSPYLSAENYQETLLSLIEMFYAFKSETWDAVTDKQLIGFMKESFDIRCGGSLELLESREIPRLLSHIHSGGTFESFKF